jgi:hypothetical protein
MPGILSQRPTPIDMLSTISPNTTITIKDILTCDISSLESPIDPFQRLGDHNDSENLLSHCTHLLFAIKRFELLSYLDLNGEMFIGPPIYPYR